MLRYVSAIDASGKRLIRCSACGYERYTHWPIEQIRHACSAPPAAAGPGTTLLQLLARLRIPPDACDGSCERMRLQMDAWGPEGCREHQAEIVAHLRRAYKKTDWPTALLAGGAALATGLALRINPLDPLGSLVAEAIRRSEIAAAQGLPFQLSPSSSSSRSSGPG